MCNPIRTHILFVFCYGNIILPDGEAVVVVLAVDVVVVLAVDVVVDGGIDEVMVVIDCVVVVTIDFNELFTDCYSFNVVKFVISYLLVYLGMLCTSSDMIPLCHFHRTHIVGLTCTKV